MMKKILLAIILLMLSTASIYAATLEDQYDVKEIGRNNDFLISAKTKDGKNFAFVANKDGKQYIVKNGVESEKYDDIRDLTFSINGKCLAYWAKDNGERFVVKDGIKGKRYSNLEEDGYDSFGNIVFSPDEKGFSYVVFKKNEKRVIVKDGVEGKKYDQIGELIFSPDSKSFAYLAKNKGKWFVVKDGVESEEYYAVSNMIYSLDSKSFSYIINNQNGKNILVKDGVEIRKYENIDFPMYSPDGKNFSYKAVKDGTEFIVKDGVEGKKYDSVYFPMYSPDGKNFTYAATKDGKQYIVQNGKEIQFEGELEYIDSGYSQDGISNYYLLGMCGHMCIGKKIIKDGIIIDKYEYYLKPQYSQDGKNFMFAANKNEKRVIVKDGIESYNEYEDITELFFNQDSKNIIVIAKKKGIRIIQSYNTKKVDVINSELEKKKKEKYKIYQYGPYSNINNKIIFSPDGTGVSFWAKKDGKQSIDYEGEWFNVINGIEGEKYNLFSSPTISPDGKSIAYEYRLTNDRFKLIKDGVEFNKYDSSSNLIYSPDSKSFTYTAVKDGKKFLVKDGVEGKKYDEVYVPSYYLDNSRYNWKLLSGYSPDSKYFVYYGKRDGKWLVIKDGVEGKKYDRIGELIYSPDGKSFTYTAVKDGKYLLVKDGVEGKKYDNIYSLTPPYRKSFAYEENNELGVSIVKDGVEGKKYDRIGELIYSPDEKGLSYVVVNKDGKTFLVKDGVEGKEYDEIISPNYSPDGKGFSYIAKINGKTLIVKDGVEIKKYDDVNFLTYSLDGKILLFFAYINGKTLIVKDGVEIEYNDINCKDLGDKCNLNVDFSPNGSDFIVTSFGSTDSNLQPNDNIILYYYKDYLILLTDNEMQKGDQVIKKILDIISTKKGQEVIEKEKFISKLNILKTKTKNEKTKSLIEYIINGI